jgi:hypothetical protein
MPLAPFQSARLKLKRAAEHVAALERDLDAYLSRGLLRITTKVREDDPTYFDFYFDATEPVPPELSTVIGDFIHNLRTSLDLMAGDLVRANGDTGDNVYFPFAKSASELPKQIKKKNFDKANQDAINLLVAFEPHKNGNLALRGVHDLDIMDKHQTLLPAGGNVETFGAILGFDQVEHIEGRLASGGGRIIHAGLLPMDRIFPASFKLIFPKAGPFGQLEMIPTLYRLLYYFSRVIDAFEAVTLGQKPDVNTIKF